MRVLYLASELHPFSPPGVFGRWARHLPAKLAEIGADVRVVVPRHGRMKRETALFPTVAKGIESTLAGKTVRFDVIERPESGSSPPIWFLSAPELFEVEDDLYGHAKGPSGLAHLRWLYYADVQRALCRRLDFRPDVIFLHDWPAAAVPVSFRTDFAFERDCKEAACVLLLSSLEHQGRMSPRDWLAAGGREDLLSEWYLLQDGDLNLLRGALIFADKLAVADPSSLEDWPRRGGGHGLEFVFEARLADTTILREGTDSETWLATARAALELAASARAARLFGKRDPEVLSHLSLEPKAPRMAPQQALPEGYDSDVLELMPRDPWMLYAYWEVRGAAGKAAIATVPVDSRDAIRWELRMRNVTNDTRWTIDVEAHGRNWFVSVEPRQRYQAELWMRPPGGDPRCVLASKEVDSPPEWEAER